MTLHAIVLNVNPGCLLVRDIADFTNTVLVRTDAAQLFQVGNRVRIVYNGNTTDTVPPQIIATRICKVAF